MIFKKLTVQNFLSIRSITLDLDNQGLVLIMGQNLDNPSAQSNGAGKSSLIESFVYAIYGRTLRGIKGDSVVNKVSKKNMKIFLDFVDDDGSEYRIARYRKHNVNKNHSFLYRNGKDITPKSEADFNDVIANLLQADYLTFTSSLLYSAESFKFTSATDAEMKTTFDMMLGLDVFSKCLEITKNRLKQVESSTSTGEWKISNLSRIVADLEAQIEGEKESQKSYENQIQDKISNLNKNITLLQTEHQQKLIQIKALENNVLKLKDKLDSAEQRYKQAKKKSSQINELKQTVKDINNDIKQEELNISHKESFIQTQNKYLKRQDSEIQEYQTKIEKLQTSKDKLDEEVGLPCPTCGQPMSQECIESAKTEYDEKIKALKTKISDCVSEKGTLENEIENAQKEIEEFSNKIAQYQKDKEQFIGLIDKYKTLTDKEAELESEVDKLSEEYSESKSELKVCNVQAQSISENLSKSKEELKQLSNHVNIYDELISKHQQEIETNNQEILNIKSKLEELLNEKECLMFWYQAYSNQGIKSYILDDITPFLNKRVNKYLKKLASNHIEVKFSTQTQLKSGETREKFSIEINNEDGGSEYIANSSGERRRIDIAVNLALQDLVASRSSKKINIAIFDEAFDTLDNVGTERVIELLQELSQEKSSIFVISHNQHLQSYFDNIITIRKKGGCSTLVNQSEIEGEENQTDM